MNKIRTALIGCGRIGNRHARHAVNNGELVAVCDIDGKAADSLAEEYGATASYSIDEFLAQNVEAEIVAICTPNGLHAEHTIKCLRAGYNVLCEKPMALSVYDCGEMIKEAEKANRRLFIVKQNRYNPPVSAVKDLLDSGKLGKLYSVQLNCYWNRNPDYYRDTWKGSLKMDGGILFTQFSHFIDLLYWMVGDVESCTAFSGRQSGRQDIEFDDTTIVNCKFYNGTLGSMHFTINSFGKNMEGSLTLFAEKGTVKIGGQYLNELEYQSVEEGLTIENLPEGNPANNYGQYQGSMSNHGEVYKNVREVLTGNGVIATNGYEGLKTVEIISDIQRAVQKN